VLLQVEDGDVLRQSHLCEQKGRWCERGGGVEYSAYLVVLGLHPTHPVIPLPALLHVPEHDDAGGDVARHDVERAPVLEVVGEDAGDHRVVVTAAGVGAAEEEAGYYGGAAAEEPAGVLPLGLHVISAEASPSLAGVVVAPALESVEAARGEEGFEELGREEKHLKELGKGRGFVAGDEEGGRDARDECCHVEWYEQDDLNSAGGVKM